MTAGVAVNATFYGPLCLSRTILKRSTLKLSVDKCPKSDFHGRLSDLKAKDIKIGPITRSEAIKTAIITDPNGNQLVFAEGRDHTHRAAR